MHARYYSGNMGRFLSVDPKVRRQALSAPQFYNRYSYVQGNPMNYLDPNGECAVPAGLKEGQVGICIEAFIAADRIKGVGFGDNRGFEPNDPDATARISYKAIIDPASGDVLRESVEPGISKMGLTRGSAIGLPGTADAVGASAPTDNGTRFTVHLSGKHGFSFIQDVGAIGVNADFTVDRSGSVTRGSASPTKGYPSVEGYAYRIVQGELVIEVIYRSPEKTPEELQGAVDEPLTE